jgi:hypothetical protein
LKATSKLRPTLSLRFLHACSLSVVLALAAPALGQAPPTDEATADAVFHEARALLDQGKLDEACAKFAASQRLSPTSGTLLNLGDCEEKRGHFATALGAFMEAQSGARALRDTVREEEARRRAKLIEDKVARLTLKVEGEARAEGW